MHRITRTHEIDAGHRVCGHGGKCANLHGHRFKFDLTCEAVDQTKPLDNLGMVVDFGVIKDRLCSWLDRQWDHRMLLWEDDPLLPALRDADPTVTVLPVNPTAENLAALVVEVIGPNVLVLTGVKLVACTVHETAKCSATYTLP
jgi:6-pyruvoyltetrahydropterin/6-carboxytetrahydropterin synthase